MTHIKLSKTGRTAFEQLIGHNSKVLQNWINLENSIFINSSLSDELLEQVRRTLAFGNKCEYCMVKAGRPNLKKENQREQIATGFAELFALDHLSISKNHFKILREEFTEKEISELCSFISFITASQKLGRIFNLTEDYQPNKIISISELKNNFG